MSRIVLLIPSTSYRAGAFLDAAARLGLTVTVGSDHASTLATFNPGGMFQFDSTRPDDALADVVAHCSRYPPAAVIGTDDETTLLAARACAQLKLPHNPPEAVALCTNKLALREALHLAKLNCPRFQLLEPGARPEAVGESVGYPLLVKPLNLCASTGVIKVSEARELVSCVERVRRIMKARGTNPQPLIVERFIPGAEYSLEAFVEAGQLRVLTLFDKPDPLDGPFFEETLYVSPSRLAPALQARIIEEVRAAANAIGLESGPIHAEVRLHHDEPFVIELAPRTIGGLCAATLRVGELHLEELVLQQALGHPLKIRAPNEARGVMMIPIPSTGTLSAVRGLSEARCVDGVCAITITINVGEEVTPLPEGDRYLGFIFARAHSPQAVESALRSSHQQLAFDIAPDERNREPACCTRVRD